MLLLDQGPKLQIVKLASFHSSAGIDKKDAGVDSHNALGGLKRYHAFLINTYKMVKYEHPALDDEIVLQLATNAGKDTVEPSELVPILLVFGVVPRLLPHTRELLAQKQRTEAIHVGRMEIPKLVARMHLRTAAHINLLASTDSPVCFGNSVLVHGDSPVARWVGPIKIIFTIIANIILKCPNQRARRPSFTIIVQDGRLVRFFIDRW